MRYSCQQSDWPEFRYDLSGGEEVLLTFAERTGHASGLLNKLTADAQVETTIEGVKTKGSGDFSDCAA